MKVELVNLDREADVAGLVVTGEGRIVVVGRLILVLVAGRGIGLELVVVGTGLRRVELVVVREVLVKRVMVVVVVDREFDFAVVEPTGRRVDADVAGREATTEVAREELGLTVLIEECFECVRIGTPGLEVFVNSSSDESEGSDKSSHFINSLSSMLKSKKGGGSSASDV